MWAPLSSTTAKVVAWTAVGVVGGALAVGMTQVRDAGPESAIFTNAAQAEEPEAAPEVQPQASASAKPERPEGRKPGRPGPGPGPGHFIHGEGTVRTPDGFKTGFTQRGEVTAVSADSITLKSPDGYTKTYAVTADTKVRKDKNEATIADVKVGDKAGVVGLKDGDNYVLKGIHVHTKAPRPQGSPPAAPAET